MERQHVCWAELLWDAVEQPGRMLEAYTAFHNRTQTAGSAWRARNHALYADAIQKSR